MSDKRNTTRPPAAGSTTSGAAAPSAGLLGWVGVVLVTLCGGMAAWVEALLVPYYVGSAVVPIAVLLALLSNWFLPRMARALGGGTVAAALPFTAWLAVILLLAAAARPEGDVILPGSGGAVVLVGYGVMLAGALVGMISVIVSAPPPTRRVPVASR